MRLYIRYHMGATGAEWLRREAWGAPGVANAIFATAFAPHLCTPTGASEVHQQNVNQLFTAFHGKFRKPLETDFYAFLDTAHPADAKWLRDLVAQLQRTGQRAETWTDALSGALPWAADVARIMQLCTTAFCASFAAAGK
jgi:hypothetical protein